jgi:hypothetical protein
MNTTGVRCLKPDLTGKTGPPAAPALLATSYALLHLVVRIAPYGGEMNSTPTDVETISLRPGARSVSSRRNSCEAQHPSPDGELVGTRTWHG